VIQQVGTAMEIFDDPANRFVANFVGSINLLPGHSALGRELRFPGEADVVIRPHTLALAPAPGDPGRIWLPGTVAEREFLGAFIRYTVKVGEQQLVVEEPHRVGRESHRPGDAVHVGIDPAQVRLLAAG
jgi:iron(III) transport system ATP-binding protein